MQHYKLLFILLFSFSTFFSLCPQREVEFFVPAVIKPSQSEIVKLSIKTMAGNGTVYVSISPPVGVLAQQSIVRAINYAFLNSSANINECDVFVNFYDLKNSSFVEGPSASLAIALATKAILNNLSYPESVIVTGEIFSNGLVGPVGGIIDKVKAAQKENKTKIITPLLYFYEKLLLSSFEKNITVVEVKNFDEAYKYLFLNFSYSPSFSTPSVVIPNNLKERKPALAEKYFEPIAKKISYKLEETINTYSASFIKNPELAFYLDYFKQRIELNNFLISRGYLYSAANNAFLDLMDAKLLKQAANLNPNLDEEFRELDKCLKSFEDVELTKENFELVAGAQARYIWAKTKFENLKNATSLSNSLEEQYLILREIYSAQSWCLASVDLISKAKELKGQKTYLNISLIEREIENNLKFLSSLENSKQYDMEEINIHINYAKRALEEKKYAGALFDLAYTYSLISFEKAKTEDEEEIIKNIEKLSSKTYSGLWANLYQSQGQYLYFISKTSQERLSAYSAFLLAQSQEEFLSNLDNFIVSNSQFSKFILSPTSQKNYSLEDFLVSAIIFICFIFAIYLSFSKKIFSRD